MHEASHETRKGSETGRNVRHRRRHAQKDEVSLLASRPDDHRRSFRFSGRKSDQLASGERRVFRVCGRVHAEEQVEDRPAARQAEQDGQPSDAVRRIRFERTQNSGPR